MRDTPGDLTVEIDTNLWLYFLNVSEDAVYTYRPLIYDETDVSLALEDSFDGDR